MRIAIFGLSLSSSWGNGHAVTYRSLIKGLHAACHDVTFLERNVEWYRDHRDFVAWPFCDLVFYDRLSDLARVRGILRDADAIIVGSYVPDAGIIYRMMRDLNKNIVALYDIDTPVTLADLRDGKPNVFDRAMIADCDLYLSFTGGPFLQKIARDFGARLVRPLYCSVDPDLHAPVMRDKRYALSYLGTYSMDRQKKLDTLLFRTAETMAHDEFIVGGAQFPPDLVWPGNVIHVEHVAPPDHPAFYAESRATLNITRADMIAAGYSPSIRLFEAASCGTAILTDNWPGLPDFFNPSSECILVEKTGDVTAALDRSGDDLSRIAQAARERTLDLHTGVMRARELIAAFDAAQSQSVDVSGAGPAREPIPRMHVD